MSDLARRENTILVDNNGPTFGATYQAVAYEVGAQVSQAGTGTTINVRAGHGFAALDKLIIGTDIATYVGVDSVGATTVVVDTSVTVSVGDILVNLGPDGGSTEPFYNGSPLSVYSDMDGTTALTNATATANGSGLYGYWHNESEIWELILDAAGSPVAIIPDAHLGSIAVQDIEINGDLNHDGTNVGFYGIAPIARPSAYTQTYATADKTHDALTSATLTDSTTGTANTTVEDVTASHDQTILNNNFADLTAQVNALRADLVDLKNLVNSVIDDLQALGLVQ